MPATRVTFLENGGEYLGWIAISDHKRLSFSPERPYEVKVDGIRIVIDEPIHSIGEHSDMKRPYEEEK